MVTGSLISNGLRGRAVYGKRFEEHIRTQVATMAMKKMKEYLK
jgi:hypothetical protein